MRAPTSTRPTLRLGAAALLLAACAGCSDAGAEPLSAEDLAGQLDPQLQELKGEQAEVSDLACDGELAPEVDAEQRCHFTDRLGDRYGLSVTVTAVEGDELTFDLAVDPGQTVEPDELEPELGRQLATLNDGVPPDDVSCPGDLPGIVDATLTCVLSAGSDRLETYVTVTSAEGPDVAFDVEVADEPLP